MNLRDDFGYVMLMTGCKADVCDLLNMNFKGRGVLVVVVEFLETNCQYSIDKKVQTNEN